MAETSCAFSFTTLSSSISFSSVIHNPLRSSKFSFLHNAQPFIRPLRFSTSASSSSSSSSDPGNFLGDDAFGFFPWSQNYNKQPDIQWVPEERVTLFTADGLIQIGGSLVPRRVNSSDKQEKSRTSQRFQRYQESDYMDPDQGLCLGALFDIAATNGLDTGRRLCIFGFCRSIEMLSDVVEDIVVEHGGEVVAAEKAIKGGLHEKLKMTVAVPLLWGVPPAAETLHLAVRSGGGIVEKVSWQWDFL